MLHTHCLFWKVVHVDECVCDLSEGASCQPGGDILHSNGHT